MLKQRVNILSFATFQSYENCGRAMYVHHSSIEPRHLKPRIFQTFLTE